MGPDLEGCRVAPSATGIVEQIREHAGSGENRFISWRGAERDW